MVTVTAPCHHSSMNLPAVLLPSGRLARGPCVIAILAVYLASFLSQALLAAPVTARAGLWPFALVQAVLIWAWYVIHARRLHDAGRAAGLAVGIAAIYALAVVLLVLVMLVLSASEGSRTFAKDGQAVLAFFMLFYLLLLFSADPGTGAFGYWLMGFLLVLLAPAAISFGFTIWTGTRPADAAAPPAP